MDNMHEPIMVGEGEELTPAGPRLVLVLGGARSGKSTFAERLVARSGRKVAFIATATASDEDMRARIERHRAARPVQWWTIEEPLDLARALRQAAEVADVILLDCMTVWLGNWMLAHESLEQAEESVMSTQFHEGVLAALEELLSTFAALEATKTLVLVSNEVGLGVVPAYTLGRAYRDLLGLVNQRLAAVAGRVYLMVAGLAVDIKRLHEEAML